MEGESLGLVKGWGVELLSTKSLSSKVREKHVKHVFTLKNPRFLGKSSARHPSGPPKKGEKGRKYSREREKLAA